MEEETWTWVLFKEAMTNCLMTKFWSVFLLLEFAWISSDNENQREPNKTSERQTAVKKMKKMT